MRAPRRRAQRGACLGANAGVVEARGDLRRGGYNSDWTVSYGIDLMFEPGVDTNLRAAWVNAKYYPGDMAVWETVRFDPKADGINDFVYGPSDDWHVMRVKMCASFAAANGVACPPQDW